ncbi:hypothetical protein GCM10022247_39970 [Allokutzneria multivorans]|uniref:Uncharacterized protein n=1 Tax=Allokutzneria multivorans TaxID=1142134 RepID=A0ABP7SLC7_9PSEU
MAMVLAITRGAWRPAALSPPRVTERIGPPRATIRVIASRASLAIALAVRVRATNVAGMVAREAPTDGIATAIARITSVTSKMRLAWYMLFMSTTWELKFITPMPTLLMAWERS